MALTHAQDDCAALVFDRLKAIGCDHVRFNTERFHSDVGINLALEKSGRLRGGFRFPDGPLEFEDIGVVWNRRVHDPEISSELDSEPELRDWILQETKWALSTVMTMLKCPIVNPWEVNERLRHNKLVQMKAASELGFEIPETLISDQRESISEFWKQEQGEVIMKKIRKGLIQLQNGRRVLFHTSRIPPEMQNELSLHRMRFAPAFLQAHIAKKYDIRSVIVGDQVFSVAIHSQGVTEGVVDYRNAAMYGKLRQMRHEPINLGEEADAKIRKFSRRFGLTFGALDFIETPDGRLIFLEDNPNGQWAWLEHLTGLPIAMAIAETLRGLSTGLLRNPAP